MSTLRERIEALLNKYEDCAASGLESLRWAKGVSSALRSALESETREADAYDLICDDCGLSGTCDAYNHGRRRPCADFARSTPPPANTENDQ